MSNKAKLAELRTRTDRDLLVLIERELNRSMVQATAVATIGLSIHTQAAQGYRRIVTLLFKVPATGYGEGRERIEAKLKELRILLDAPNVVRAIECRASFSSGLSVAMTGKVN